jgi:hypothetical protein
MLTNARQIDTWTYRHLEKSTLMKTSTLGCGHFDTYMFYQLLWHITTIKTTFAYFIHYRYVHDTQDLLMIYLLY